MMKRLLSLLVLVAGCWCFVIPSTAGLVIKRSTPLGPADGLVGYWPFDGPDISADTAFDRSGQGNDGTIVNGSLRIGGRQGQAIFFDGGNYIDAGNPASLQITGDASFSAWVNMASFNSGGSDDDIISKGASPDSAWQFKGSQDCGPQSISLYISGNGSDAGAGQRCGATPLQVNTWYHAAGVYKASSQTIDVYLNGELDNGDSWGTVPGSMYATTANVTIGRRTSQDSFHGIIDEPRVYDRALTAAEIRSLYNAGRGMVTAAPQDNNLTDSLVGYWPFNGPDISGSAVFDRSGQGNNGTMTGGPLKIAGKLGQGLQFDGSDDYVDMGDPAVLNFGTGSFSVSAWLYASNTTDFKPVIGSYNIGGMEGWEIQHLPDTNRIDFVIYDSGARANYMNFTNNAWHHVAGVRDGTTTRIYVDGVKGDDSADTPSNVDDGTKLSFGGWLNPWKGKIDDVRLYNRALSLSEVTALYAQGASRYQESQENWLTTGLVGYWPFNGPDYSGAAALDRSGQGNNGTMVNSPLKVIGKVGQGLQFLGPGADTYISVPHKSSIDLTGSMTLALWVKPAGNITYDWTRLLEKNYSSGYYIGSGTGTNDISYWLNGNEVFDTADDVLSIGTWKHVAVTFDDASNEVILYIDGNSHTVTSYAGTISGNGSALNMTESGNRCFNGAVDEVRIYNRALSADEVKRLYAMGY